MPLKLTTLLVPAFFATGVAAQTLDAERKGQEFGPGDELRQFSKVIDPSKFNLSEEIWWGALAVFAPDSFRGKVPLFIYDLGTFDCSSNMGGALIDRDYGVAKLGRSEDFQNQGETSGPIEVKYESWASRDVYCADMLSGKGASSAASEIPSDIWIEMFNSQTIDEVLISTGPIAGGEPVAKWWGQCDLNNPIWKGSPCADRLGQTTFP